ncbi:MAG: helix-turn-helix transcriptional regulator [Desulfobacteraceae bacterium]|nr:helix-turn-helix transcriptional regulator [Desulfobacteraceae bacterium]
MRIRLNIEKNSKEIALVKDHPIKINRAGRQLNMAKNTLKKIRESLLMSKSELAREANVSPITITRIEEGKPCRMETKRKILLALGYSVSDAKKIFSE